jgi:hypothetical protein
VDRRTWTRRAVLRLAAGGASAAIASFAAGGAAQTAQVPAAVQARLIAKVAFYDRNFAARAIHIAKVLLIHRANDAGSMRAVEDMKTALASVPTIAGLPHDEEVAAYVDAPTVASTCVGHRIAIVYLSPGLGAEIAAIRTALASVDVLSVAADPDYVPQGIVLGFRMVGAEARLLLHRGQARAQNVDFGARILRRMTIYE